MPDGTRIVSLLYYSNTVFGHAWTLKYWNNYVTHKNQMCIGIWDESCIWNIWNLASYCIISQGEGIMMKAVTA